MAVDLNRIAQFIDVHPRGFPNLVDLPYRLSSWSLENPKNIRIWETDGHIQAVGMVQMPWLSLDYVAASEELIPQVFEWGAQRGAEIAHESGHENSLAIYISPENAAHIPIAESLGFQFDDGWTLVHLERDLIEPLPAVQLPEGFTFRLMSGRVEAYVELHQTAFGTTNMRVDWRARMLTMPQYRPELNLFIVDRTDRPVAFCIGWRRGMDGMIEPLGVHPDYQRLGLGRAMLLENLRRLQSNGANRAFIHAYKADDAAVSLYQLPGNGSFSVGYELRGYVRSFS